MKNNCLIFGRVLLIFVLAGCHGNDSTNTAVQTTTTISNAGYSTPDNYTGMTLVWQDEFSGTALNTDDWNYETGGGGWGNNELEYYQSANTSVSNGYLIIKAKQESAGGNSYTSSRLTTQGKKTFQYGRVDIRALLPKGKGIWPALWMLGSSITTVNWPACGEIDIMEMVGGSTGNNTVYGTSHWDDSGMKQDGGSTALSGSKIFADEFHVFTMIWNASSITYYVDDVAYHTTNTTPDALNEFRAPFFFLFNVAVGGDWPGNPDGSTIFSQQMVVDYIRVFQ
jgi:beta-glucanase (GH16 family)